MKPLIPQGRCPDCQVVIGQEHDGGCDVARCLHNGHQRLLCDSHGQGEDREHDCGQDIWTGYWPGELDAARLGFWCRIPPAGSIVDTTAEDPEAKPNLNRLHIEARWDRKSQQWVALPPAQPGDSCADPRDIHNHWCGFCGAARAFSRTECSHLLVVPPCPRCGETQWKNEIDEMAAPDYRERSP